MRVAYSVCSTGLMLAAILSGDTVSAQRADAPKAKWLQFFRRRVSNPGSRQSGLEADAIAAIQHFRSARRPAPAP